MRWLKVAFVQSAATHAEIRIHVWIRPSLYCVSLSVSFRIWITCPLPFLTIALLRKKLSFQMCLKLSKVGDWECPLLRGNSLL